MRGTASGDGDGDSDSDGDDDGDYASEAPCGRGHKPRAAKVHARKLVKRILDDEQSAAHSDTDRPAAHPAAPPAVPATILEAHAAAGAAAGHDASQSLRPTTSWYSRLSCTWPRDAFATALGDHVAGQDAAIGALCDMLSIFPEYTMFKRTMVVCLSGPSGVGKTQTVETVLSVQGVSRDPATVVRICGTQMTKAHDVARITGANPGTVGYQSGKSVMARLAAAHVAGMVTGSPVVIFFDEADKAHLDCFTALMNVFDRGIYQDSDNQQGTIEHLLVLMTANFGDVAISQLARPQRLPGEAQPGATPPAPATAKATATAECLP
jgi:hypothetical protein